MIYCDILWCIDIRRILDINIMYTMVISSHQWLLPEYQWLTSGEIGDITNQWGVINEASLDLLEGSKCMFFQFKKYRFPVFMFSWESDLKQPWPGDLVEIPDQVESYLWGIYVSMSFAGMISYLNYPWITATLKSH